MTGTTRIPAAEITGFKGALIKRFAKKTLGQVPSSLGVYWHNQKVLMGMAGVGGKVQKWDACDEQLKSFAHMAVAAQVGCSWCLDFNYFEAHNKHLDMDKAREIPRWRESDVFSPLEREVLEYAEAMTVTPPTVTDEMVAVAARPARRRRPGRAARRSSRSPTSPPARTSRSASSRTVSLRRAASSRSRSRTAVGS